MKRLFAHKVLLSLWISLAAAFGIWYVHRTGQGFLTAEEQKWLHQNYHTITVAQDPRWTPNQRIEEQQIYNGIASDFMALIERKLGVRFLRLHAETWSQVLELETRGQIDIHPVIFQTPERDANWLFTDAYMRIPVIAVMRASLLEKFDPSQIWDLRMAVGYGYGIENFLRQHAPPTLALIPVESDSFGLIKAALGEIDVMVTDLASASYYIEEEGLTNLRLAAMLGSLYEFRFAARRDKPMLHTILNKALAQVSREERREIYDRWIVFDVRPFYRSTTFWYVAGLTLLGVLLVVTIILVWNAALKVEVNRKTAQLLEIQKELEIRVQRRTAELASANAALQNEMAERAETARDLLHVSGNERARIGRDLHDSVGQKLVGILYLTRVLFDDLEDAGRAEADAARKVLGVVEDSIAEMKQIVRGLLPVDILKKGFVDALAALVKESGTYHNVEGTFIYDESEDFSKLDNAVATNLYRIAQEAIGNAVKHAKGITRFSVQLRIHEKMGLLQIENDGSSMEAGQTSVWGSGMGLKIMRYRAMLAGGTLDVVSRPAGGTIVVCRFDPHLKGAEDGESL